mmetsp:Transcript_12153/g.34848  ORF Transcript_12153/g.34848 Transcript_12153/m.34848 type:complete len:381 (+) Transcript_12153:2323-3465(+)
MHLEEGPVAEVVARGVRPLVLMVHADDVAELVGDVPLVQHAVAPAEVDDAVRAFVAPPTGPAQAVHVAPGLFFGDEQVVHAHGRLLDLLEHDARSLGVHGQGRAERRPSGIVLANALEYVGDHRVLLPNVRNALRRRLHPVIPRAVEAGPAVVRVARPLEAVRLAGRQVGRAALLVAALLADLADPPAQDDGVAVLRFVLHEVPVALGHAPRLEGARVAVDAEAAVAGDGAEAIRAKGKASRRRRPAPDVLVEGRGTATAHGAAVVLLEQREKVQRLGGAELEAPPLVGLRQLQAEKREAAATGLRGLAGLPEAGIVEGRVLQALLGQDRGLAKVALVGTAQVLPEHLLAGGAVLVRALARLQRLAHLQAAGARLGRGRP